MSWYIGRPNLTEVTLKDIVGDVPRIHSFYAFYIDCWYSKSKTHKKIKARLKILVVCKNGITQKIL